MCQPRLWEGMLVFALGCGNREFTVFRLNPEDQKKDIVFLCVGQQLLIWGRTDGNCIIARKVRILYTGGRSYGDPAIGKADKSHSGL